MKHFIFLQLIVFVLLQNISAQKYISKNGHIWIYSYTPVEIIEGHNHQAVSILDASNGDIQFSLLVKSFEFKVALMQEHFNENYMESDKIPKAGFKGKIVNWSSIDIKKDGVYDATVTGDLTIHGVTKNITTSGKIEVKDGTPTAKAKFTVIPQDYDIKIPDLVKEKIAKEIEINIEVPYSLN